MSRSARRLLVIGLDGVPHSFLLSAIAGGRLPNLARILGRGAVGRMTSTLPFVSSVAWASFMTGQNPGKHGIFGFVDRVPGSYRTYIPTSRNLLGTSLWEHVGRAGRKVVVMNVPGTYPPRPVNGLMVSCFLSPSLAKATYPPELADRLASLGYRIDADPRIARQDLDRFLGELQEVLERRMAAVCQLLTEAEWDLFVAHVMETDRLHHFFWRHMEEGHPRYRQAFFDFYARLDEGLARMAALVEAEARLVMLSDHGFCSVKQEVYLNTWLEQQGWLEYEGENPSSLEAISPRARAFSLEPGRIYLHVRDREARGRVAPGSEYERLRDELAAALLELRDPDTKDSVVARVYRREEIYHGPAVAQAADLVLLPAEGYDLKAGVRIPSLTTRSPVVGTHTYHDAFLFVEGAEGYPPEISIVDVMPTLLRLMGLEPPADLDGRVLIHD